MDSKSQFLFQQYLFDVICPYTRNVDAVRNAQMKAFAEKIICMWDDFSNHNSNPSREQMREHLTRYKELLCTELDGNSILVQEVEIELRNQISDIAQETKVYDHLLRIRAVFGLNN